MNIHEIILNPWHMVEYSNSLRLNSNSHYILQFLRPSRRFCLTSKGLNDSDMELRNRLAEEWIGNWEGGSFDKIASTKITQEWYEWNMMDIGGLQNILTSWNNQWIQWE